MADLQHETAKRSGDLAAQLAAEVRAGRPERARLRAYCGCEAARFVLGRAAPVPYVDEHDPAYQLRVRLDGLERLAWAPPRLNVDPAQWVLVVAACGVARECQIAECYEQKATLARTCKRTKCAPRIAAIEAAEQWTRCPCRECLGSWESALLAVPRLPRWLPGLGLNLVQVVTQAAQIIGPDAAREAAARAVLEVTA